MKAEITYDIYNVRSINKFIARVEKTHNDSIKSDSGLELWVDNRYNEHLPRVHHGTVISAPKNCQYVPKGAKIWFHHNVTKLLSPQKIAKDVYYMTYDDTLDNCINNHAIAYEKEDGTIEPLGWFMMVNPVGTTEGLKSDAIQIVNLKNLKEDIGEIVYANQRTLDYFQLKIGDKICYQKSSRYEVDINGQKLFRIRPQTALYKIKEDGSKES